MGIVKRLQAFWAKFSNDWCMNLAGLLAYNFLTAIYLVAPNLKIEWQDTWRGALVAAVLFELVNLVFPLYVKTQHGQFGQFAFLLAILTFWFWVISLILLLGAELNSFAALGQRAAGGDLPTMLHDIQVPGRVPRAGEDADAPPPGHPLSARGEQRHTETKDEGATTGEGAARPPEDPDGRTPRPDGQVRR